MFDWKLVHTDDECRQDHADKDCLYHEQRDAEEDARIHNEFHIPGCNGCATVREVKRDFPSIHEDGIETVLLHMGRARNTNVFHIPNPETGEPYCADRNHNGPDDYRRRDITRIPPRLECCHYCDPTIDTTRNQMERGQLSNKLEEMDPEELTGSGGERA